MDRVEILDVVPAPLDGGRFWGAGIDLPKKGECRDQYAIVLAGWILHRSLDAPAVCAMSEGRVVARWPANLPRPDVAAAFPGLPISPVCGFKGVVHTLDLPAEFALRVEMHGGTETQHLGTVYGRRASLTGPVHERIRPLLITTLGRTGSTLLMQLLGQHPRIVVHPPFPYETRVAEYWTAVFTELSLPTSYLQALVRLDDRRLWWVGNPAFPSVRYLDQDAAARALGGPAIEAMATFARRQVATFYETSAGGQGKATAGEAWFAEKQLPRPERQCLHAALFPDRREIYLVRDFRDMVASILSFNRKRGHLGFGRSPDDDDDRYMVKLAGAIEELMQAYRGAGEQGMLVRYEDLVREPGAVLARILECLGLERSDARVQAMVQAAAETEPDAREAHRTSSDPVSSIGRHRRDLSPRLIERCDALFERALAACGYTVPQGKP